MKILVYSPAFLPGIGGLELNVAHLAEGLALEGHQVAVVTTTAGQRPDSFPFRVLRRPGPLALLRSVRWCDVFLQHNVSLRGLWPLLLVRRPWVVVHHSWYTRTDGRIAWQDRLKRRLLRRAAGSISVSEAMAADLETPSVVIQNAYRHRLFRRLPDARRDGELLFVGRLVSDKGADLLLEAMALLAERGRRPRLTVIGDGPEREPLARLSEALGVTAQVGFVGTRQDEALVREMNGHRVLVVPSRYQEPFGIVALEGIACGCLVVGSAGGGLKEAIGPAGITFANGDVRQLADAMARALDATADRPLVRTPEIEAHLARHATDVVLSRYLTVLEAAVRGEAAGSSPPPETPRWVRSSS